MENEQTILEKITDTDSDTDHTTQQPQSSVVDLFISGDLDGVRQVIHTRTVDIVSALVKKSKE